MALNTKQSLVDTAVLLSGKEGVNLGVISELLVPIAFQRVGRKYATDDGLRPYSMAILPLTVVNGVATLPDAVVIECLKHGVLRNALDETQTQKYFFIKDWDEFTRPLTPVSLQLGTFTVHTTMLADTESNIYAVEPGATYDPTSGFTGNMTLTTPVVPSVPASATGAVEAPLEMQQDIVVELARMIRGSWLAEVAV